MTFGDLWIVTADCLVTDAEYWLLTEDWWVIGACWLGWWQMMIAAWWQITGWLLANADSFSTAVELLIGGRLLIAASSCWLLIGVADGWFVGEEYWLLTGDRCGFLPRILVHRQSHHQSTIIIINLIFSTTIWWWGWLKWSEGSASSLLSLG